MADHTKLIPHILKWEGGWADDPDDLGGKTMKGITIGTWLKYGYDNDGDGDIDAHDLKHVQQWQWEQIFKHLFWDALKADKIDSQLVADLVVDIAWGSGSYRAGVFLQEVCNSMGSHLQIDGKVGALTLAEVNRYWSSEVGRRLHNRRTQFYYDIVKARPANKKFLKGWLNRANDLVKGRL